MQAAELSIGQSVTFGEAMFICCCSKVFHSPQPLQSIALSCRWHVSCSIQAWKEQGQPKLEIFSLGLPVIFSQCSNVIKLWPLHLHFYFRHCKPFGLAKLGEWVPTEVLMHSLWYIFKYSKAIQRPSGTGQTQSTGMTNSGGKMTFFNVDCMQTHISTLLIGILPQYLVWHRD